jgi:hypothetical protein
MGVALGSMAMQASRSKQLSTSGALPLILTPGQYISGRVQLGLVNAGLNTCACTTLSEWPP